MKKLLLLLVSTLCITVLLQNCCPGGLYGHKKKVAEAIEVLKLDPETETVTSIDTILTVPVHLEKSFFLDSAKLQLIPQIYAIENDTIHTQVTVFRDSVTVRTETKQVPYIVEKEKFIVKKPVPCPKANRDWVGISISGALGVIIGVIGSIFLLGKAINSK